MLENQIVPWHPLNDLPSLPCGIEIAGTPEEVEVRAVYSFYEGEQDLLISLKAEVYGCFSEATSPPVFLPVGYPRLKPPHARSLWPLMEVKNSTWLASHAKGLWTPAEAYRHYRIVSEDGSFDALVREEPAARWVEAKPQLF